MNLLAATTENSDSINQVYNVAFNERTSLNQLYQLIRERLAGHCHLSGDKLVYREFREGDVRHSLADISKAKKLLKYHPNFDIKKGLDEAIFWYVQSLNKITDNCS
jgi:UDP-N-acetylglucosamine 4-epimerase